MTESLVLGVGSSMFGVAIALWGTDRLITIWPEALPRLDAIRVDGAVLAFALVVAIVASTLAGLLPAFRGAGEGLAGMIQSGGTSGFGVQPTDAATLSVSASVLIVVATVAAYIPARRAARINPTVVLRHE